jgi:hypothetical protein
MKSLILSHIFIQVILLSQLSKADWLCVDSSGRNTENFYQVCGIGQNQSEAEARALAFEAAKNEFKRICAESDNCQSRNKNLEIKRTECKKLENEYKCYRLLEYSLLEGNITSSISTELVEKQLDEKRQQLIELRKKAIELERLKVVDKQIELEKLRVQNLEGNYSSELLKNIDKMTVELENDTNRVNVIKPARSHEWLYKISISASGPTLKNHSYDLASYRFEVERKFTDMFGINLTVDPYASGKNTSKDNYTSTLLAVGVPFYLYQQFSFRPELIQRSTKYSPTSGSEMNFNQSGYGITVAYNTFELTETWTAGLAIGLGVHNYSDSTGNMTALSGSVGLAIAY